MLRLRETLSSAHYCDAERGPWGVTPGEAGAVYGLLRTEGVWVDALSLRDLIRCGLEITN